MRQIFGGGLDLKRQFVMKLPIDCYSLGHSLGYTWWKGHVKTGQAEQLDMLCWVPEALHRYNSLKMSILVFLLNMLIFFGQDLATVVYIISRNPSTIVIN